MGAPVKAFRSKIPPYALKCSSELGVHISIVMRILGGATNYFAREDVWKWMKDQKKRRLIYASAKRAGAVISRVASPSSDSQ